MEAAPIQPDTRTDRIGRRTHERTDGESETFQSKGVLLWLLNVAGNNKTLVDIHEKVRNFLPDFNQIWNFHGKSPPPQYQISLKSVHERPALIDVDRRTVDRQT